MVASKKDLQEISEADPNDYDIILITSTYYNQLVEVFENKKLAWRRFIYDEASSVHIPNMKYVTAGFYWFITATYPALLNFRSCRGGHLIRTVFNSMYHELLDMIVIKCPDDYIDQSYKVGEPIIKIHQCVNLAMLNVISDLIPVDIKTMISAGDVKGAIEHLGGKNSGGNIIELVKNRKIEELKEAEFKCDKYQHNNNTELHNTWKDKVNRIKNQLKEIDERFNKMLEDDCPICYDSLLKPIMMPCCQFIYCGKCVFTIMNQGGSCPSCRAKIDPKTLMYISDKDEKKEQDEKKPENKSEEKKPKNKLETVIDIITEGIAENKNSKFIIFSDYEESIRSIKHILHENKLSLLEIKGSKATREKNIESFKRGKSNILFLNSKFNGSGINLQETTDIILFHTMDKYVEEQVIGRVKRIGKETAFTIHKLVDSD
jgi:uncharacterized Zn finger protein (UPF0148 family)